MYQLSKNKTYRDRVSDMTKKVKRFVEESERGGV
jgi:hypothetical protein